MVAVIAFVAVVAFAQAPQGVTASMYEPSAPELQAYISWQPVAGATAYNVYKEPAALSACPSSGFVLDSTVTGTFYLDDPNPNWYEIPVTSTWRAREWCYAVSAIVGGVEGPKSNGVFVAIGNSGYLVVEYVTACGGARVIPFPYMQDQIAAHFYYTDPSGTKSEIPTIHLYNAYPFPPNDPLHAFNEEWEWKLPNGSIPWAPVGKYTYTLTTPDGGRYAGSFAPPYQQDASYYNQDTIVRVQNGPNCAVPDGPGGNYSYWQNVTR